MRTTEYLETLDSNEQVTFIIAEAQKDEHTPFYSTVYRTTPIRSAWEWAKCESLENHLVMMKDHPPIDVNGAWHNWYKDGRLKCCVLISEETLRTQYSEKQAQDMIAHYEKIK